MTEQLMALRDEAMTRLDAMSVDDPEFEAALGAVEALDQQIADARHGEATDLAARDERLAKIRAIEVAAMRALAA